MSKPIKEDILIDLVHRSKALFNNVASANKCSKTMSIYRYQFVKISMSYHEKDK